MDRDTLFGPFFVVLNPDGSIHRHAKDQSDSDASPCIFGSMGPHDNHSKHGRKVVRAWIKLDVIEEMPAPAEVQ